ncbi:MAG: hypothetical protein IPJ21_08945 [Sterolibacteriaceae bacterium]|nr:hypothetical protein [Sterolibacteriaceae bacterium]
MALYGIDARARSALRALARFRGLEAASRGWANAFAELLVGESGSRAEAAQALSRFVRLFFELPARDFDPEWLEELGGVWRSLRHVGCNADLPLRAAHEFTKGCIELLKRERDTYSRLDAEIALSVGSASLYLCSVLADATEEPGDSCRGGSRARRFERKRTAKPRNRPRDGVGAGRWLRDRIAERAGRCWLQHDARDR